MNTTAPPPVDVAIAPEEERDIQFRNILNAVVYQNVVENAASAPVAAVNEQHIPIQRLLEARSRTTQLLSLPHFPDIPSTTDTVIDRKVNARLDTITTNITAAIERSLGARINTLADQVTALSKRFDKAEEALQLANQGIARVYDEINGLHFLVASEAERTRRREISYAKIYNSRQRFSDTLSIVPLPWPEQQYPWPDSRAAGQLPLITHASVIDGLPPNVIDTYLQLYRVQEPGVELREKKRALALAIGCNDFIADAFLPQPPAAMV